jgi:hypothetical protein
MGNTLHIWFAFAASDKLLARTLNKFVHVQLLGCFQRDIFAERRGAANDRSKTRHFRFLDERRLGEGNQHWWHDEH